MIIILYAKKSPIFNVKYSILKYTVRQNDNQGFSKVWEYLLKIMNRISNEYCELTLLWKKLINKDEYK